MNKPDYILTIPADEYHAATRAGKYLSSHYLADFIKCPALYFKKVSGEIAPKDSASFTFGRATHSLVLEGRGAFDAEFLASDGVINEKTGEPYGKTTKVYQEWLKSQTKTIVSMKDFALMEKLQLSVWVHPVAADILTHGIAEGTIRFDWNGEPCQTRLDWYDPDRAILADLKTCDNLDFFASDAFKYAYPRQLAFYRKSITASGGQVDAVYLIAVEKQEPFRAGVWMISNTLLDQAEAENESGIAYLQECRALGVQPTKYEELRVLEARN